MRKDKYTITKKRDKKLEEMRKKADLKYSILLENEKKRWQQNYDYIAIKIEKKKNSYIKKKEDQFRRKMLNEIREFEGRPKKVYKTDAPKIKPLEFAMKIAQENARLRDTNEDGKGRCISCGKYCERGELAGGHRYSRRFQTMCLEIENINAQCHTCNFTTGPRGDTVAKERVNNEYDRNLDIKYGDGTAQGLKEKLKAYMHGKGEKYDLEMKIPALIDENEELWKSKNFYAPAKKWRATRSKYVNRT